MKISQKKAGRRAYAELIDAPVSSRGIQLRLAGVPAHIAVGAVDADGVRYVVELSLDEAEQVARDVAAFHTSEAAP